MAEPSVANHDNAAFLCASSAGDCRQETQLEGDQLQHRNQEHGSRFAYQLGMEQL
jgi:hypothetical protein